MGAAYPNSIRPRGPGKGPFHRNTSPARCIPISVLHPPRPEVLMNGMGHQTDPDVRTLLNAARKFLEQDRPDEAIVCCRRATALDPGNIEASCNLVSALRSSGQVDEAIQYCRQAITANPQSLPLRDNLLFSLQFSASVGPGQIFAEHVRWFQQFAAAFEASIQPHQNDPSPDRRLKVGYVSPHFCSHVLTTYTLRLLREHDHNQFEIICYPNMTQADAMTAHFRKVADGWRDISRMTDDQAAELIRADRIDILIDLTMHMDGNRLLLFARKPAPVQITWLAYPGTTGLQAIDYRLTDPYLDPPGLFDRFYSEKTLLLPETFWALDPLSHERVSELPALQTGAITFGCLNTFFKVNEASLRLWARVMQQVAASRLLLLVPPGSARQRVLETLTTAGISPERVLFVARQTRCQYLATYHRIDIALDTLPYNGHTTSIEALWMGVPVITLVGETVVGRAGLSQLTNARLPELITYTPADFVKTAVELAADIPRLKALRATLRTRLENSPLLGTTRFARNIESAYRQAWSRWCSS